MGEVANFEMEREVRSWV